jgi:hypothetical protein
MAHYALVNNDNLVVEVITGRDENEIVDGVEDWEAYYSQVKNVKALRTSYNTYENQHLNNGVPFRGNFAGIGYTYDETLDAFIPPKPTEGDWILDESVYGWVEVTDA